MTDDVNIDFWKAPGRLGQKVTFMVPPVHQLRVVTNLRKAGVEFTLDQNNVQEELIPMWEATDRKRASPAPHVFDLLDYNTIEDINAWLVELVAQCREGFTCEVFSLGTSYEGRSINAFKIYLPGGGRKHYYLEANTHAREWITSATLVNIMDNFVKGGSADGIRMVDSYDWTFVPVVNVDGYAYTWSDDRLWRKNRNPVGAACVGVDINRNYAWSWGEDGASHQPCGETYCGPSAGSELETQAISTYLQTVGADTPAMLTLHSYGNMWMFPWGNTVDYAGDVCQRTDDHADLMLVADIAANAIENTYNTVWGRGNSCEVIYATSGGTNDYAKGAAGIKYTFVAELRGNSFVLPAPQIPLSYEEVLNGVVAMVDSIGA
jgi:carboxypeptidase A2